MDEPNREEKWSENEMEIRTEIGNNPEVKNLYSSLTKGNTPGTTQQNVSLNGMAASNLESNTVLDLPHFQNLPNELKHKILRRFPIETKKAARLVSKEWELILRDYVNFTPILTSETFAHVTSSELKFDEMTISGRILDIPYPEQKPAFLGGSNIRKLHFKKFTIDVYTLKWIFTWCSNVEKIRVDFFDAGTRTTIDEKDLFSDSNSVLPTSISLCQNLLELEIYIIRSDINSPTGSRVYLDCSPLQFCIKLKTFNVRSSAMTVLRNRSQLPVSVERLNVIMFHSLMTYCSNVSDVFIPLRVKEPSDSDSLTAEDLAQLSHHFPNLSTYEFIPNLKSEWEIFRNIISDIKAELLPEQRESLKVHVILNLNFAGIF